MSRPKIFPFQFKLDVDVVNAHCNLAGFWCINYKECTLTELIGLLLTTVASRNGIQSRSFSWNGEIGALHTVSQNVPIKQTTEQKLVILES